MAVNRKLGRPTDQRLAILRNQTTDLILHNQIETTEARAKEVKSIVDSIIALAIKEKDNFEEVDVKVVNKNSKALSTFVGLNSGYTDIKRAIKIGSSNIAIKDNIHYIHLFCTFLIKDFLATLK